jgi:hypothetical protein
MMLFRWVSLTLNTSCEINPFYNVELAQAGTGKLAKKNCAAAIDYW